MYKDKNLTKKMESVLPLSVLKLLRMIGGSAEDKGYASFAVGGIVRDVMLGKSNYDIDIVTEGDAVKFGKLLAEQLEGTYVAHGKFGTSSVYIDNPGDIPCSEKYGQKFKIDIATARKETYESPAVLPSVEFSSLKDDLFRRDFTINAMAISLQRENFGQLVDFFGGTKDIKAGVVRALHEKSFIDDPTRIFRAVRFEQRFSFRIDRKTKRLITDAVKRDLLNITGSQRIRDEIILMLKEPNAFKTVKRMSELGELKFIHKHIALDKNTESIFSKCAEMLRWYAENKAADKNADAYVMYLMVLTKDLTLSELNDTMLRFCFNKRDRDKIIIFRNNLKNAMKNLTRKGRILPSEIYKTLKPLSHEALLVILSLNGSKGLKGRIKNYIVNYSGVKINISGRNIKERGLKDGPEFKIILDKILYAKLDGLIKDEKEELLHLKGITR